jgi:hypothetical protein
MDPIARSAAQHVARNAARLALPAPQEREAAVVDVKADALLVDIKPDNSLSILCMPHLPHHVLFL